MVGRRQYYTAWWALSNGWYRFYGPAGTEIDEAQNRLTTVLDDDELAKRSVLDAVHKLRLSETVASDRSDPARVVLWSMEDRGMAEKIFDIAMLNNIEETGHACEVLLRAVENKRERFPEDKTGNV